MFSFSSHHSKSKHARCLRLAYCSVIGAIIDSDACFKLELWNDLEDQFWLIKTLNFQTTNIQEVIWTPKNPTPKECLFTRHLEILEDQDTKNKKPSKPLRQICTIEEMQKSAAEARNKNRSGLCFDYQPSARETKAAPNKAAKGGAAKKEAKAMEKAVSSEKPGHMER